MRSDRDRRATSRPEWMRDVLSRYGLALVLSAIALLIRAMLPIQPGTGIFPLSIAAVVFSAWYGGRGPGLIASLVSVAGVVYWFVPPIHTFEVSPFYVLAVLVFAAMCLLLSEFSAGRRRTEHALQAVATRVRESEVRLSALAGSTDEAVFELDGDGTYLNAWTSNEAMLSRPRHELIGRTLTEIFDEHWGQYHLERLRRVLASGTPEVYEWRFDRPAGKRWFLVRMNPMPRLDGERRTVCSLVRDITRQKADDGNRRAQHGVALALADADSLAAAAPRLLAAIGEGTEWDWGALWTVDRARGRLCCESVWNAPGHATPELDELSREIALETGEGGPGRVCETGQPDWVPKLGEQRRSGRMEVAAQAGLKSGVALPIVDVRPPESSAVDHPPVVAPALAPGSGTIAITGQAASRPMDGEVLGVIELYSRHPRERDEDQLAAFDVMSGQIGQFLQRKRTEAELRQREQELRARQEMLDLAQTAAGAMAFEWYFDARASENRWSPELEAMYGLAPGVFDRTYQGWKQHIHPDDWPSLKDAIEGAVETGDVEAEYRVIHKRGNVHWLHAKGRLFLDTEGRPERVVGFMIDITDRRQAEEELRVAETRLRTFVDQAADAFLLADEKLTLVDVNRQACKDLGRSREELIGMRLRDLDAAPDEAAIARLARRPEAGETVTYETLYRRKDGTEFPVEIRAGSFIQGKRTFFLALARDISDRKRAEDALQESRSALQLARTEVARVSRLTTLGELTASIAHEVGQPLGAIGASAGAALRWLAADPPEIAEARDALDHIAADCRRARETVTRIRALARPQASRRDMLDINFKITEVLALTEHELESHDIVVRTDLDRTLPRLRGDRVLLQQVLLNLVLNAAEAMSHVHDRPRELTIVSRHEDPDSVLVEVRDSGSGLDSLSAEQLFEPFYTTKAEGIGIGLSISRSIIEAHGGRLWAAANSPYGAVFRFSLPIAAEEVA